MRTPILSDDIWLTRHDVDENTGLQFVIGGRTLEVVVRFRDVEGGYYYLQWVPGGARSTAS